MNELEMALKSDNTLIKIKVAAKNSVNRVNTAKQQLIQAEMLLSETRKIANQMNLDIDQDGDLIILKRVK